MNARLSKLEKLVERMLPSGDMTGRIIHSDGQARDYAKLLVILYGHVQDACGVRTLEWTNQAFVAAVFADTPQAKRWKRYLLRILMLLKRRVAQVTADPSLAVPLGQPHDLFVLQEEFRRVMAQDEAAAATAEEQPCSRQD